MFIAKVSSHTNISIFRDFLFIVFFPISRIYLYIDASRTSIFIHWYFYLRSIFIFDISVFGFPYVSISTLFFFPTSITLFLWLHHISIFLSLGILDTSTYLSLGFLYTSLFLSLGFLNKLVFLSLEFFIHWYFYRLGLFISETKEWNLRLKM